MGNHAILIVEDDPALAELLASALGRNGYACHRVDCREAALASLQQHEPAGIALLDLGLPPHPNEIREGIRLLEQLMLQRPSMKVIVLTGQDQESAALAAIRAGAFDFLAKPVQPTAIVAAVERARLFADSEAVLRRAGESRITIAARTEEGIREAGQAAEERLLRQVLDDTDYNVTEAARRLGLPRENLYYFIRKYGIQRHA